VNKRIEQILEELNGKKVGIFCDDANLFYAQKRYGWRVDFKKLREFIGKYCNICFINYYVAIPAVDDEPFIKTENFLSKIDSFVAIKRKPIKYISEKKKANVDVEIVLDVARVIDGLDVVIIMSGDSDFLELKNYVIKDKGKQIIFMGYKENMAWELILCKHIFLNKIKEEIILK